MRSLEKDVNNPYSIYSRMTICIWYIWFLAWYDHDIYIYIVMICVCTYYMYIYIYIDLYIYTVPQINMTTLPWVNESDEGRLLSTSDWLFASMFSGMETVFTNDLSIVYIYIYILLYIYYTIEEWEIPYNCIFYSTTQLSSTFIYMVYTCIYIYIWIYIYIYINIHIHILLHVTCLPKLSTSFQVHLGQRCGRVARPIFLPRISVGLVGREKPWVTQVMNSSLFT